MSLSRFKPASSKIHLFNLSAAPNSQKNQQRVGRGDGSSRGGTSGKGNKGQKARSGNGKPKQGFEGGQTPIIKRFPKRGFINPSSKAWAPVNLDRLQHWIDQGRITSSPGQPITAQTLLLSGCIHNVRDGVKLLGEGTNILRSQIHITPSRASQSAIRAVEKLGGSVFCKYYNALSLRDNIKGESCRTAAAPTRREDIEWYTNWKNRGYLSLTATKVMPGVDERHKALAVELSKFKKQPFDTRGVPSKL